MTQKVLNFINGEFVASSSNRWIEIINPATREKISELNDSNAADLEKAVSAAEQAFPMWSAASARDRAKILRKISELIEKHSKDFALLETRNTGKPLKTSQTVEIPRSAHNFEFFADAATQWSAESHSMEGHAINYTLRQPLGPVACISPWNLPLYLLSWKIAPALAAGNTVIAKPSEVTPMSANLLAGILNDAGLPPGVLNILQGRGQEIGAALCNHSKIKAVSFTGSTGVGAQIAGAAAASFKKVSLELGGKNASLVYADCDFQLAIKESLRAAFSNQGQICLCASRILIEESIYPRFRDEFVRRASELKCGDPLLMETQQGSLVSEIHFNKVKTSVARAIGEGARVLCGGKPATLGGAFAKGFFFEPTVLEGLGPDAATNQEEIFGPVVTLQSFKSENESVLLANNSRYGLAHSLWTQDITRAHRVAAQLQTGIVWINSWMLRDLRTPFGGIKDSGLGREGGLDAYRFFTETKNVCVGLEGGTLK